MFVDKGILQKGLQRLRAEGLLKVRFQQIGFEFVNTGSGHVERF